MKKILLLGASGSIGTQCIDVIKAHPDSLKLVGASVGHNVDYLRDILKQFKLEYAYTIHPCNDLVRQYPDTRFYYGDEGLLKIAKEEGYDTLVNALVGFTGFRPTVEAIKCHKNIALANKETLVGGGDIIMPLVKEYGVKLYPIDSEHSAIWQCLNGHERKDVRRLVITGSGGSFRDKSRNELANVSVEDALKHPNWAMGAKITIDSATMMNKGFEVMEAHYLFDIPYDNIDVILHSQSIIHSMVEYNDGSIIAQMGCPDMRLPIKYALLYPEHLKDENTNYLDLDSLFELNFKKMDYQRYPLVRLAKEIGKFGGNFGAILIGANDEAVDLFLKGRIAFIDIEKYIFKALKSAHFIAKPTIDEIISSHNWARAYVADMWANS